MKYNRINSMISMLIFLMIQFMVITACEQDTDKEETPGSNKEVFTGEQTYPVVETGQTTFFGNNSDISEPAPGQVFYGQDAQYTGNEPSYTDNHDGTITDNVTGLMWEKSFQRSDFDDAQAKAKAATTGGYDDWRVPTIKELYSLILFTGNQGSAPPEMTTPPNDAVPFIDTGYFDFEYPTTGRYIDAQYISGTEYVETTMGGNLTFFGVNFADGRIKGYPQNGGMMQIPEGRYYLRLVRGNASYGVNNFSDNQDGTITDEATGLMWMKDDSGNEVFADLLDKYIYNDGTLNWQEALDFAENLEYAGYNDWRLPNAKELHTITDYTRSPGTTNSPAIDPVFNSTMIVNEAGEDDYGFYWSSTSFEPGYDAVYISFGRALGYFDAGYGPDFYDVHGAGAQRTDPKMGEGGYGFGPQGDVRRVNNMVRLVRTK